LSHSHYQRGDGTAVQAAVQSPADHQRFTRSAARSPVDHPPPAATAAPRMNEGSSGTPGTGRCGCHSQRSKGPPGHAQSPRRSTAPEAVTRGQGRPASAFFQHRCGGRFDSGAGCSGGVLRRQRLRHRRQPGLAGRPRADPDGHRPGPDRTWRAVRQRPVPHQPAGPDGDLPGPGHGGDHPGPPRWSAGPVRCCVQRLPAASSLHHQRSGSSGRRQSARGRAGRWPRPPAPAGLAGRLPSNPPPRWSASWPTCCAAATAAAARECGASSASPKTGSCWPPRPTWPASPPSPALHGRRLAATTGLIGRPGRPLMAAAQHAEPLQPVRGQRPPRGSGLAHRCRLRRPCRPSEVQASSGRPRRPVAASVPRPRGSAPCLSDVPPADGQSCGRYGCRTHPLLP
jgi:hypothetical protein